MYLNVFFMYQSYNISHDSQQKKKKPIYCEDVVRAVLRVACSISHRGDNIAHRPNY